MERSDSFSTIHVALFGVFYITVFILSTVGNIWVLVTCYRTLKQKHFPFMWLLANLASADLCFTILTTFNSIAFLCGWFGGNATCKPKGFLIEASYTTTIVTLSTISYERLQVTTNPINARVKLRWPDKQYIKLIIIWSFSLVVCSPLLFIYRVETRRNSVVCLAKRRTNFFPQIFYSVHTTIFYVAPLLYMIYTQSRIFHSAQDSALTKVFISRYKQRQRKIAKTLFALTIAFVVCWSPFMVIRTLMYHSLASPGFAWKISQLLIFLNTGLDPLLYGYYGGNLKSFLRPRLLCQ